MRKMVGALRADVQVALDLGPVVLTESQAGHFIHSPSGTERVRRSVLMRDGMIFSNQVISLPARPAIIAHGRLTTTSGTCSDFG